MIKGSAGLELDLELYRSEIQVQFKHFMLIAATSGPGSIL